MVSKLDAAMAKVKRGHKLNAKEKAMLKNLRHRSGGGRVAVVAWVAAPQGQRRNRIECPAVTHVSKHGVPCLTRRSATILLEMLSAFSVAMSFVCPAHSWCIIKGTLLCAMRDNGLIPWEDDVDTLIACPSRADWKRFWEISFPILETWLHHRGWLLERCHASLAKLRPGRAPRSRLRLWKHFLEEARVRQPLGGRAEQACLAKSLRDEDARVPCRGSLRCDIHVRYPVSGSFALHADSTKDRVPETWVVPVRPRAVFDGQVSVNLPCRPHIILQNLYGEKWRVERRLDNGSTIPPGVPKKVCRLSRL